jgi:hypothetical protein
MTAKLLAKTIRLDAVIHANDLAKLWVCAGQLSQMLWFCSNLSESPSWGQINLTVSFRGPQPEPTLPDGRIIIPGADVVVVRTAEDQRQPSSALAKRFDSGCFLAQRISQNSCLQPHF